MKFCNILVYSSLQHIYHMAEAVPAMVIIIIVVSVLTHCTLLHSVNDLKVTLINMQHRLIRILMLHKFELVYKAREATRNIWCV